MPHHTMQPDRERTPATPPPTPRWVKVFGIVVLLVAVLVGGMLLLGHGPGQHVPSSNTLQHSTVMMLPWGWAR